MGFVKDKFMTEDKFETLSIFIVLDVEESLESLRPLSKLRPTLPSSYWVICLNWTLGSTSFEDSNFTAPSKIYCHCHH